MSSRKLLVLHGSRQTGQLLMGRMEKLKKRLKKKNIELVAPDAPHKIVSNDEHDKHLLQWWERHDNEYQGLVESMNLLETLWSSSDFEGIIGFSQGARLAHLIEGRTQVDALPISAPYVRFPLASLSVTLSGGQSSHARYHS